MRTLCGTPLYVGITYFFWIIISTSKSYRDDIIVRIFAGESSSHAAAPEIVKQTTGRESEAGYGLAVDMWSLGVILYILWASLAFLLHIIPSQTCIQSSRLILAIFDAPRLSGLTPFNEDRSMSSLFEQIIAGRFDFPVESWELVSEEAKDLIRKLLTVDPVKRLTISQVLHPAHHHDHQRERHINNSNSL